ncbi:MAG: pilus assembly protein FimV [Planctomycetota bacterium]|jgi:pilus assembly protein FimV
MRVKLSIVLAFATFLSFTSQIAALALSEIELQSHLNQPLLARIKLLDVPTGELNDLNISVSEIIDTVAGGGHTSLRYEVVTEGSISYLRISSRNVVREPILSFVVELNWSTGHLLRNYALIIDPQ